jgi:hypothetical protein
MPVRIIPNVVKYKSVGFKLGKIASPPIKDANKKRMVLQPKVNQIYDDYIISKQVLGLGISGKVLCCTSKTSNKKYALKVDTN